VTLKTWQLDADRALLYAVSPAGQAETIFQTAILEQGRGRVLDTLAEIQERNRAVKDLEASLLELHQIFLDMAVLVEAQGEMLDNIEQQVCSYVGKQRDEQVKLLLQCWCVRVLGTAAGTCVGSQRGKQLTMLGTMLTLGNVVCHCCCCWLNR
jgi:hypothetical protein